MANETSSQLLLNLPLVQIIPLSIFCSLMTIFGIFGNGTGENSCVLSQIIFIKNKMIFFVNSGPKHTILKVSCVYFLFCSPLLQYPVQCNQAGQDIAPLRAKLSTCRHSLHALCDPAADDNFLRQKVGFK